MDFVFFQSNPFQTTSFPNRLTIPRKTSLIPSSNLYCYHVISVVLFVRFLNCILANISLQKWIKIFIFKAENCKCWRINRKWRSWVTLSSEDFLHDSVFTIQMFIFQERFYLTSFMGTLKKESTKEVKRKSFNQPYISKAWFKICWNVNKTEKEIVCQSMQNNLCLECIVPCNLCLSQCHLGTIIVMLV